MKKILPVLIIILFLSVKSYCQDIDWTVWNDEQLTIATAQMVERGENASAPTREMERRWGKELAAVMLSEAFEKGNGVSEDPYRAFSILATLVKGKFTSATDVVYKEATYEYACMLLDGYGCKQDIGSAIQLLVLCAETGYRPALRELALVTKEQGISIHDDYLQLLMRESYNYDSFVRLPNGYIQTIRDGQHGIIDRQGKVIASPRYDEPIAFSESGLIRIKRHGRYGFMSCNGTEIIAPRFLTATDFREGLAIVCDDGGWSLIDENGNETMIDNFDAVGLFSDGLAIVKRDNLQGAIDHNGRVVIPPHYEELQPFSCGLAAVRKGNKWGYVDHNGRVVIDFLYDEARPFVNPKKPFALVNRKGKEFCINKNGKKVKP